MSSALTRFAVDARAGTSRSSSAQASMHHLMAGPALRGLAGSTRALMAASSAKFFGRTGRDSVNELLPLATSRQLRAHRVGDQYEGGGAVLHFLKQIHPGQVRKMCAAQIRSEVQAFGISAAVRRWSRAPRGVRDR